MSNVTSQAVFDHRQSPSSATERHALTSQYLDSERWARTDQLRAKGAPLRLSPVYIRPTASDRITECRNGPPPQNLSAFGMSCPARGGTYLPCGAMWPLRAPSQGTSAECLCTLPSEMPSMGAKAFTPAPLPSVLPPAVCVADVEC